MDDCHHGASVDQDKGVSPLNFDFARTCLDSGYCHSLFTFVIGDPIQMKVVDISDVTVLVVLVVLVVCSVHWIARANFPSQLRWRIRGPVCL